MSNTTHRLHNIDRIESKWVMKKRDGFYLSLHLGEMDVWMPTKTAQRPYSELAKRIQDMPDPITSAPR